jgi:UDP-glucuronate decarboxylase
VTGGSGFLGSHLCERLLAEGAEVICLDNCFTGARRNIDPIYLEIDQIYNLARLWTL